MISEIIATLFAGVFVTVFSKEILMPFWEWAFYQGFYTFMLAFFGGFTVAVLVGYLIASSTDRFLQSKFQKESRSEGDT